jgi:hypothetical protein
MMAGNVQVTEQDQAKKLDIMGLPWEKVARVIRHGG